MKAISKVTKTILVYLLALLTLSSAAIFLLLPSMTANTAASGDTAMYSVGPGGGGAVIYPTINPQDGSNITLSCDMGSTYTSINGGASFKSHQFWDITKYDYNPHDPNIIYAYHRQQVYISRDKGQTFDYFAPKADAIEKIGHNMLLSNSQNSTQKIIYKPNAHFSGHNISNVDATRIEKVYVHPADPDTIFILQSGYSASIPPTVAKSTDGGETFSVLTHSLGSLLAMRSYAYGIAIVTSSDPNIGEQTIETPFSDYCDMLVIGDLLYIIGNNGIVVLNSDTGALVKFNPIKSCDGQFVYRDGVLTTYIIPANPEVASSDPAVAKAAKKNNCLEIKKSIGFDFDTWTTVVGGADFRDNFWGKLSMHWTRGGSNMVRIIDRPPIFTQLKVAAADPNTMYIYFNSGFGRSMSDTLDRWYGTNNSAGVAVTRDGGETWFWAYEGTRQYDYMTIGSRDMMNAVGRIMFDLVIGPDPNQVIISDHYSAFMTLDGGWTWKSLESDYVREVDGRKFYTTTGVEPAGQGAFAVDPSNPNHQLSGWTDIGLWESFDGGVSWSKLKYKVDETTTIDPSNAWGVAFDPNNPNIILAGPINNNSNKSAELTDSIMNVVNGEPAGASIRGYVMRSTNGGATWTQATINEVAGFPNTYLKIIPTDIVFDPCKPGVAYFASNGLGVFRSADSGATWTIMSDGIEKTASPSGRFGIGASELTLCADNKTLFLTTARQPNAQLPHYGDIYYLDCSTNSTTWTKLNRPNDTKSVYYRDKEGTWIYSIDRAPNGLLYAGTAVRKQANGAGGDAWRLDGECGGVYVSADMGATWRQMYDDTVSVYAVKVDSRHPKNLYISALGKVFMSDKGAATTNADWVKLAEIPHMMPYEFYEDPINQNRMMTNTRCGGTWSFPIPPSPVHSVTYNLNGGSGTAPTEANKEEWQTFAAVQTAGITAPTGQGFMQWNTDSAGKGTAYAPGALITMPNGALTLYAIWEDIPYAVTYDLNGGFGVAPTETSKTYGASFAAAQFTGITAPAGKRFKQWNTDSAGAGTAYAPGASITMPASNLTLYAIWEDVSATTYAVTYGLNGGTGLVPIESNKAAGVAFAAAQLTGITAPPGKQFKQWNTNSAGTGTAYALGATITMPASNLTLYAIWEDVSATTYAVTYDLNGGTGIVPTESNKTAGAAFAAAQLTGITAPLGKQFKQWNTNSAGTGTAYTPGVTVIMPASELTLYAIWEEVPVTPPTSPKTIFTTHYESNCRNWFMFIVLFGWLWMWFLRP